MPPASVILSYRFHVAGQIYIGAAIFAAAVLYLLAHKRLGNIASIAPFLTGKFRDLRKSDHSNAARERELYFQSMAEAAPDIIWTATPDGSDDYFNQRMFDYTGMTFEHLRGSGWTAIVHSDDLQACLTKWENARRMGTPYDVEYRLRRADGNYRWFIGRGNPIRNSNGEIVKWFGTCTDIEDQKQNQQILEEQVLERTMQLEDMNRRLQDEMAEKDFARHQFDEQNAIMMRDLEKRSERATLLAKMGELLQSCVSRDEVIKIALGFAPKIFPAARGLLALLNSSRNQAQVIGSWNECQMSAAEFDSNACWALRTTHPHLVPAGDATARCPHASGVSVSYICIPILAQGETLGILHLQATTDGQLESAELSFKNTFAGQVGLSIANIRLQEKLLIQSVRDPLTGLYNRRHMDELLEREVRRASRGGYSLGILMIDLDHFKNFNDTYGHEAGDAILRETASLLVRCVRAEDFVFRFGGEEFVILLPTANLRASQKRAEHLRVKMKELTVVHQGTSMGMLTISVGVAVFPQDGLLPEELMTTADASLYEAKRAGRDQVAVASPNTAQESPPPTAGSASAIGITTQI